MDDLEIGKLYVLIGQKHVSFYLYDDTRTRVLGKLFPFQPFVVLKSVYRESSSWRYIIKILTHDGILGWFAATEHYTDFIKPIKELNDYENSTIR